jgi:hypothetical protein
MEGKREGRRDGGTEGGKLEIGVKVASVGQERRAGGREGGREGRGEGGREGGSELPRRGEGDGLPGLGRMVDDGKGDAALDDGWNHEA